ncbi:MAG: chalcone isomerase family protein [Rhodoferax sp.]|uniref:chalcone isomerase family protein n=1 Tax=Rhodoferax sp. TaxID=50421 RepID=UPI0032667D4E
MKSLCVYAAVWLGMLAASASVSAATVAGIAYADSVDQRGTALQLNGAGIRYKAVFKVYTAGLYLANKASTPEDVMAMPGPKRISITMLREIDANELGKLFTRGVEDNTGRGELSKLVPSLYRMGQVFAEQKKLLPGDTFELDWMPGVGTVLLVRGKPQGEAFPEAEFFNALLRIWLGPSPADWKLKDALLGKGG